MIRFVNTNVLDFMKPSEKMMKLIEKSDRKKYLPTQEEQKAIKVAKIEEREEIRKQRILKIKKAVASLGIQLKKRARGPNPLSVIKKVKKE